MCVPFGLGVQGLLLKKSHKYDTLIVGETTFDFWDGLAIKPSSQRWSRFVKVVSFSRKVFIQVPITSRVVILSSSSRTYAVM